jgi:hypothetical protein
VRGLFFVQSECLESNFIASRPFRVNAESFGCTFNLSCSMVVQNLGNRFKDRNYKSISILFILLFIPFIMSLLGC